MRPLSSTTRHAISGDRFYDKCCRYKTGKCKGRVTLEHALLYAGKQIDEAWAIVPLCTYHHAVNEYQDGGDLDKDYGKWVAISRMTEADMAKYPKVDWRQKKRYLDKKYEGT